MTWLRAFTLIFLMLVGCAPASQAKLPPPMPRVYTALSSTTCKDGSNIQARFVERGDTVLLTRDTCRDLLFAHVSLPLPRGQNAIETDFLVYAGKLFEDRSTSDEHALLYCRTEGNNFLIKKD